MPASLLAVVVDCRDSLSQASWWAVALGHQMSERNTDEYEVSDPSSGGTPLYFMNVPEAKAVKNRVHVDIRTDRSLDDEVARLVAAGGTLVELRQDRRRSRIPTLSRSCRIPRATSSACSAQPRSPG